MDHIDPKYFNHIVLIKIAFLCYQDLKSSYNNYYRNATWHGSTSVFILVIFMFIIIALFDLELALLSLPILLCV